ncbi:MAG: indole-3-glycerol phosphate synthase TrpC [Dehalococcoidia bacterium]|nr:MAG: indole-3-glycerol phosphate synthase TrpC [Dehalococcoidia bacterium]
MDARATGTILDKIVADRRVRLAEDRARRPEETLRALIAQAPPPIDFARRLREGRRATPAGARLRIIGEVKRASPSKGLFDADLDAAKQARAYAVAGVAAISVLTEPDHFRGSLADLEAVRAAFGSDADRPAILRKEFIFDPYQVVEARAAGADALLLIVMMLEPAALASLLAQTEALGMQALVEVHDEAEMRAALDAGATILGVNNRDLRTFAEDLGTTERVAALVPDGVTLVAESAIRHAADARRMAACGAHALLVGEALVTTGDIAAKARELMLVDDVPSEVRA